MKQAPDREIRQQEILLRLFSVRKRSFPVAWYVLHMDAAQKVKTPGRGSGTPARHCARVESKATVQTVAVGHMGGTATLADDQEEAWVQRGL